MNGLEMLKAEMRERGCTKNQTESRAVAVALEILSEDQEKYTTALFDTGADFKRLCKLVDDLNQMISSLEHRKADLESKIAAERQELRGILSEEVTYIKEFCKRLSECDTNEGRDTMRRAQMFVNTVKVDTKYDNTAFIAGLAAILSEGSVSALKEYKKINPGISADAAFLAADWRKIK